MADIVVTPTLFDEIISYAKIPEDDPDAQGLFDAAEAYITNAIEEKDAETNEANPLFCLAVKMLVAYWYDNRPSTDIPNGIIGLTTQLKYSYHRHRGD